MRDVFADLAGAAAGVAPEGSPDRSRDADQRLEPRQPRFRPTRVDHVRQELAPAPP